MKPVCLTIAGSDSSAGAGIQADLKTFANLGCYAATVITALTAQNTKGVHSILPVNADFVLAQLDTVMNDMPVSAIKIGMVRDESVIEKISVYLATCDLPIVLDPVLVSSSGTKLLSKTAASSLVDLLLPLCKLVTPNVKEAELLSGFPVESQDGLEKVGNWLLESGVSGALITGGDVGGSQKNDVLFLKKTSGKNESFLFKHESINTQNSHGTGCTLSSAITAYLSHGIELPDAVQAGIVYTHRLLENSQKFYTGRGFGGLDHFYSQEIEKC